MVRIQKCENISAMVVKNLVVEYFKKPDNKIFIFEGYLERLFAFMRVFVLCLFVLFIVSIITAIVRAFLHIEFRLNSIPLVYFWMINILLVPLMEEVAFRLPLVYSRENLCLSGLVISYLIISYFTGVSPLEQKGIDFRFFLSAGVAVVVYLALWMDSIQKKIALFWADNERIIHYLLIGFFCMKHLDNYILTSKVLLLFPILLFPQFLSGIFLSFVRVRFGFNYSILLHMMINAIAYLPLMILHYVNR